MDRDNSPRAFKYFQYEETILKYIKYNYNTTVREILVTNNITFRTDDTEEDNKRGIKVLCRTLFNEHEKDDPFLELEMQSYFTVSNTVDLKNVKQIIEKNKLLKKYLTTPVLSEITLMVGIITQKAFKVPNIVILDDKQ